MKQFEELVIKDKEQIEDALTKIAAEQGKSFNMDVFLKTNAFKFAVELLFEDKIVLKDMKEIIDSVNAEVDLAEKTVMRCKNEADDYARRAYYKKTDWEHYKASLDILEGEIENKKREIEELERKKEDSEFTSKPLEFLRFVEALRRRLGDVSDNQFSKTVGFIGNAYFGGGATEDVKSELDNLLKEEYGKGNAPVIKE